MQRTGVEALAPPARPFRPDNRPAYLVSIPAPPALKPAEVLMQKRIATGLAAVIVFLVAVIAV